MPRGSIGGGRRYNAATSLPLAFEASSYTLWEPIPQAYSMADRTLPTRWGARRLRWSFRGTPVTCANLSSHLLWKGSRERQRPSPTGGSAPIITSSCTNIWATSPPLSSSFSRHCHSTLGVAPPPRVPGLHGPSLRASGKTPSSSISAKRTLIWHSGSGDKKEKGPRSSNFWQVSPWMPPPLSDSRADYSVCERGL